MMSEHGKIVKKHCFEKSRRGQKRRQGGARGGGCPPNVEKDGPRNSSEFDEKNWGGGVSSYFQM